MDRGASIRAVSAVAALILAACSSFAQTPVHSTVAVSSSRSTQAPEVGARPTTDNELTGIACRSPSDCIAVGQLAEGVDTSGPYTRTLILENHGTGWGVVSSPNAPGLAGSVLNGVTCVTSTKCIAVGYSDNSGSNPVTLIEEDVGDGWTIIPSPNPSAYGGIGRLSGVACSDPTRCVAVGDYQSENGTSQTLIEEDHGSGWYLVPSPNTSATEDNRLNAVTCVGQSLCIAIGSHGPAGGHGLPLIELNSGSGWTMVAAPGAGGLSGIACLGTNWCVATGGELSVVSRVITERPLIEEMSAGAWAVVAVGEIVGTLGEVACPTATYCISLGTVFAARLGANVGPEVVAERVGATWTLNYKSDFKNDVDSLGAVACPTSGRCIAAGDQFVAGSYPKPRATFIAEHTAQGWTVDPSPNV